MAVMTDVREAAQGLTEYAIHRSMIGQDDRIWAYNTILECIGATGPALDMTWALQNEKLSLLHPDTLPDFDLEGTLAALSEAAVAKWLEGKTVVKAICVPGKLVNLVVK